MAEEKDQDINYEEENNESSAVEARDKLKKLKEKLNQCQTEKQANLTGWQRAQADFINYRRRQEEQMGEWSKMFGEGLLKDILPVLDTLDASAVQANAKEKITSSQPSPSKGEGEIHPSPPFAKEGADGLNMVRDQLMKILAGHGLMEMKSVGEKFNPEYHEAIEQVEGGEEGIVAETVQKGYSLNGKIIRVAKVKVSK